MKGYYYNLTWIKKIKIKRRQGKVIWKEIKCENHYAKKKKEIFQREKYFGDTETWPVNKQISSLIKIKWSTFHYISSFLVFVGQTTSHIYTRKQTIHPTKRRGNVIPFPKHRNQNIESVSQKKSQPTYSSQ